MNKFKQIIISTLAVFIFAGLPVAMIAPDASAQHPKAEACKGAGGVWRGSATSGECDLSKTGADTDLSAFIQRIVNILLFVIGAAAVLMIVIGGIRYVTSNGDSASTKSAKDTILYAVIGLVVAVMAYAIVNFVMSNL